MQSYSSKPHLQALEDGTALPSIVTPPPGPQSRQLTERLSKVEPPTSSVIKRGQTPVFWERTRGANIVDVDDNVFVDLTAAFCVATAGHSNPRIVQAIAKQSETMMHSQGGLNPNRNRVELAEKLSARAPGELSVSHIANTGSEAVETALKLSRAYFKRVGEPNRTKFISRKGSYHGATIGALALGGSHLYPKIDYEPLMPGVFHVPQPLPYRCEFGGQTPEECAELCVKAVEETIKFQDPDTIAAVVAEPVSSPLGCVVPGGNYWPRLREICDRYGCLLIADEVIIGFGRTGKMFATEH